MTWLRFPVALTLAAASVSAALAFGMELPASKRVWSELQDPPGGLEVAIAGVYLAGIRWFVLLAFLSPAIALRAIGRPRLAWCGAGLLLAGGGAASGAFTKLSEMTGVRWTNNIEAAFTPGAIDLIGGLNLLLLAISGCLLLASSVSAVLLAAIYAVVRRWSRPALMAVPAALCVLTLASWWFVRPVVVAAARPVFLLSEMIPLPLPPRPSVAAAFDAGVNERLDAALTLAALSLENPTLRRRPVPPPSDANRPPDVVVVLNETFRADALNPELMPQLWEAAAGGLRAEAHRSAGNASELGIYGLVRGTYPAHYGRQVAKAPSVPALVAWGRSRGMDCRWWSGGHSEDYKGLQAVLGGDAFDAVEEGIAGQDKTYGSADEALFERLGDELTAAGERPPRLTVVFGMGLHYPYGAVEAGDRWTVERPPGWAARFPSETRPDVLRYANSARRLDATLGRFLGRIDRARTVVLVTGDHGESFRDDGLLGHAGAPSDVQTRTPLVVVGPGIEPGVVRVPTSHVDIVATLIHAVDGVDPGVVGHGRSLLSPLPPDRAVAFVALGQRHPYDLDTSSESSVVVVCPDARPGDEAGRVHPFLRFTSAGTGADPRLRLEGWVSSDGRYSGDRPPPVTTEAIERLIRDALLPLTAADVPAAD